MRCINQAVSVGLGGSMLQSGRAKVHITTLVAEAVSNIFPSTSPRAGRAVHHIKECGLVNKPSNDTA